MDRSLRMSVISGDYEPWHAGFDTRRVDDILYVTGSPEDRRLHAGDRIVQINGRSPGEHRARFQKNFLYGTEPEREIWSNVLKMADRVTVEHADGSREELPVLRLPGSRPAEPTRLEKITQNTVRIEIGSLDDPEKLEKLVAKEQSMLDEAGLLILDLRHAVGNDPSALLPLQVLNYDNKPIKGLFVAGNTLGGRYGTGYATPCTGNFIGIAGTHGRIAGKNAAKA